MTERAPLEETAPVMLDILYGHIKIESRMRPEGNRWIGEGRAWHYDGDGNLTKDTGWEPTGVVMIWPEPQVRHWWWFWQCV